MYTHYTSLENYLSVHYQDNQAWLIYADYLQILGDKRGELIVLEQEYNNTHHKSYKKRLKKKIYNIYKNHQQEWLDPEVLSYLDYIKHYKTSHSLCDTLDWYYGFLIEANLKYHPSYSLSLPPQERKLVSYKNNRNLFKRLLESPASKLLYKATIPTALIQLWMITDNFNQIYHPHLKELILSGHSSCSQAIYLDKLFPNLDSLTIKNSYISSYNLIMEHAKIKQLTLTQATGELIANLYKYMKMPSLETILINSQICLKIDYIQILKPYFPKLTNIKQQNLKLTS